MDEQELNKAKELLIKYRRGQCSEEEAQWVEHWYQQLGRSEPKLSEEQLSADLTQLQGRLSRIPSTRVRSIRPLHLAAACLFLIFCATLAWITLKPTPSPTLSHRQAKSLPPGGNRAILVLADGNKIDLTTAAPGAVTSYIHKDSANTLVYATSVNNTVNVEQHTLVTARGGTYQVLLPDGSRVILNAASSLTFPSGFKSGTERRVRLHGEAWFEVTGNPNAPFIVECPEQTVTVLGTRFNVKSYPDDQVTETTLEQGKVAVLAAGTKMLLQPGEKSVLAGTIVVKREADLETALAWKNEEIRFKDADLGTVLRQISRWYDVDISYNGHNKEVFTGGVSRQSNLNALLKILEISGVRFRIDSSGVRKRLIVIQ